MVDIKNVESAKFLQNVNNSQSLFGYVSATISTHKIYWERNGCEGIAVTEVYFEIYESDQLLYPKNDQLLKVYKATIKNNIIEGGMLDTFDLSMGPEKIDFPLRGNRRPEN